MRKLLFVLLASLLLLSIGCDKEEITRVEVIDPEWATVVTTPATGTPQEQIDRFVEVNDMDTVVTSSGLVYVIQQPGEGTKPTPSSTVSSRYRGYLVDGRVFDATDGGNARQFPLDRVIPAWTEGVPLIAPGGRIWMLVRPSLGYGSAGRSNTIITGSSVMVFEIQLDEVLN